MKRRVFILQNTTGAILAVEGNLKKLLQSDKGDHQLLSYRQLHRLTKKAKDSGKSEISFDGKDGRGYIISWWGI